MASKFDTLKKILTGGSAQYKVPTERPSMRTQKNVFDSFQKAASSIYQQGLGGGIERAERYRDYDEMDLYPEVARALDIYADDSMVYGVEGNVLDIFSEDNKIREELEELYYERLDLDFHLWTWIRNMVKYGDHFNLLDLVEDEGVLGTIALPVNEIVREEGFNNDPNSLRFNWVGQGNTSFQNYQVSHLRILGDDRFLPYGRSVLDSGRKVYKQLIMAEDAMLIYRITRAPERRVFYIDVGNIPPAQVDTYLMQARDKLKRTPMVNQKSGNQDMRFNPESILEDFFIPVRGDRGSKIETLPGGENAAAIEDIQYLQNKLFISLGVPKSYLTAEQDLAGKGTLAQEDIKFARTIQRIQKIVVSELAKIGLIHLYLRGYEEADIYNFDLKLANPSSVTEMMNLDLIDKRFSIASSMAESPLISKHFIQKEVLQLSKEEISVIKQERTEEAAADFQIEQIKMGAEDQSQNIDQQPTQQPQDIENNSDDEEDSGEVEEYKFKAFKNTVPYDPLGTDELEGYPKFDRFERNFENSINTKDGFIKNNKTIKKRTDIFNKTITEIMKFDREANKIFENIKKDKKENKLSDTAKLYFMVKD